MHIYISIITLLFILSGCWGYNKQMQIYPIIVNIGNKDRILYVRNHPTLFFAGNADYVSRYKEDVEYVRIVAVQKIPSTEEDLKTTNYELVKIGEYSDMVIQIEKKEKETGKNWVYTIDDNNVLSLQPYEGEIKKSLSVNEQCRRYDKYGKILDELKLKYRDNELK